jgi:hypothetical protein
VGLVAVRKHPGVETPGYCRVVPLGRQVEDDEAASGLPERFAFRQVQTPRRRLAMTRQAWAKYQCQSTGVNFQGDCARQFKIQLKPACLK